MLSGSSILLDTLGTDWVELTDLEESVKLDSITFKKAVAAAIRSKKVLMKISSKKRYIRKNSFTAAELDREIRLIQEFLDINDFYKVVDISTTRRDVQLSIKRPGRRIVFKMHPQVAEDIGSNLMSYATTLRGEQALIY